MFNFRAPLACFITISGHIDIFQKISIHTLDGMYRQIFGKCQYGLK